MLRVLTIKHAEAKAHEVAQAAERRLRQSRFRRKVKMSSTLLFVPQKVGAAIHDYGKGVLSSRIDTRSGAHGRRLRRTNCYGVGRLAESLLWALSQLHLR